MSGVAGVSHGQNGHATGTALAICVLSSILHSYSHSPARLPPSSRTRSIACSHASFSLSLARFLPDSPIHSVAYFVPAFCPPSLPPHSLTHSFACFLSHFFTLNARLILSFYSLPLSLNHSLANTFFLFHFLTNYLASSLSPPSFLTRQLAFRRSLSLSYSLNNLLTRSIVSFFTTSITFLLAWFLIHSLTCSRSFPPSFIHAFVRLLALFQNLSVFFLSLFACFFSHLLIHLFAFFLHSLCCLASLLFAHFLPSSLLHSLTRSLAHLLTFSLIRLLSYCIITHLLVFLVLPPYVNYFCSRIGFLSPLFTSYLPLYSIICPFTCLMPSSFPHSLIHSLTRSHSCSSTCLIPACIPH